MPLILGQPFSPETLEENVEELNSALKQFEEKFLQDKPFIVGNEISLADLMAVVELMQVSVGPTGSSCQPDFRQSKLGCWESELAHGFQVLQKYLK